MFKKCLFFLFSMFILDTYSQSKQEIILNSINAFGGMSLINHQKTWKKVYDVKEIKVLNVSGIYDNLTPFEKDTSVMTVTFLQKKECCERTDFKHIRGNRAYNIFIVRNGEERINGINEDFVRESESYSKDQSLLFDIPIGYLLFENSILSQHTFQLHELLLL